MSGRHWAVALAIGALFGAAASRFPVDDTDVFWHLASGRWMVEHGALLTGDVFSSTVRGAPVPVHQWLGELALWGAYAAASWWGVLALRVVLVSALATIVARTALARASRPTVAGLAAFPGLALSRFEWGDRPELMGLVAFAAFVPLALALRAGDRRAGVALVPLMALWANLHGGFVVGVGLLVALALESALVERARARTVAGLGALAIAATLVNPLGPGAYAAPALHFAAPPRFIQEWGLPDVTTLPGLLWAATLLGALALAMLRPSARASDAAFLAPLAFLSLSAVRQTPLFAIGAVPFLAERLTAALPARLAIPRPGREPRAAAVILAAAILAAALATAPRDPDLAGFPAGALPSLAATRGTLFNDYDWGGYLIWSAPEHPVFVDGRLVPYLAGAVLADYREAIGVHAGWRAVLERYGVDLVLVRPSASLAVRLREAGWAPLYADDVAVLFRRP